MEKKFNIIETYNWLNEAFVHQTEETTEKGTLDSYSLENRVIYYKTKDHEPISDWYHYNENVKSDIPELIVSNTYDEKSDTGMLLFKEPVTSIGDSAFGACYSLTSVSIPNNSVTSIGEGAFGACESLTSITIPESVKSIGGSAFLNCTSLGSITIPSSVTNIGDAAFFYCESLEKVFYKGEEYRDKISLIYALEDSQVSLGEDIFNCTKLE